MRHKYTSRAGRWLAILLLAMASALLFAAPARAAEQAPLSGADTVALSITNGTTFTYGGTPAPKLTAVVHFGTRPTANYFWLISVRLDDGETLGGGYPTSSPDGMTLTFAGMTPSPTISVGQHTAVASFNDPGTKTTATSNIVSFTINKATPNLTCDITGNGLNFEGTGQALHVRMAPSWQVPVDWQDATYTVTFDGPTHSTFSNLAPDSNDEVTVTGPSQGGKYILGCMFNGTASYNSELFNIGQPYTFSAMHSLGSVQLFTNPTTLTANTKMDYEVVFHAAAGLPTPTGEFNIYIGTYYYTDSIPIGSNGTTLVHLNPLPSLVSASQIRIQYYGDFYYNEASINFPLTNPPIPSGGGSGGSGGTGGSGSPGSGNNPQSTATASETASATGTPTAEETATAASSGGVVLPTPAAPGGNGLLWLIIVLGLLVLAGLGAAGGILYVRRRAKAAPYAASPLSGISPTQSPWSSPDDTMSP